MEGKGVDIIQTQYMERKRKRKALSMSITHNRSTKVRKHASFTGDIVSASRRIESITVGQSGLRKKNEGIIRLLPSQHLSQKGKDVHLSVCGAYELIDSWYKELPRPVLDKFERTGFKLLLDGLSYSEPDTALLLSLAEKWWDTTHTFHFEKMGEMTMTPIDFCAISGLRVGGKPVRFAKSIHRNAEVMIKYLGKPIEQIIGRSVQIRKIREAYRGLDPKTEADEDILLRAFIIALLGATIFAKSNDKVHFYYLPMLKVINNIKDYNWGGAGLVFLYQQMNDTSRCNSKKLGGLWKAWEIWAREYIKPAKVIRHSSMALQFPFSLRWKESPPPAMEYGVLLQYYRIKFLDLMEQEVNWTPWGEVPNYPIEVKDSISATTKRILLNGPFGAEWYLGERVTIQSLGASNLFVPNAPPQSMLVPANSTVVIEDWAVHGKPALEFVENKDPNSYNNFRRKWLTSSHAIQAKIEEGDSTKSAIKDVENDCTDDIIPMPPWTLLLPSTVGGPNVICIPRDIGIDNLDIPPHVKHISIGTARKLLSMIGGMQHVLIEQLTNAREMLRDYNVIIQKLKNELDIKWNANNDQEDIASEEKYHHTEYDSHHYGNYHDQRSTKNIGQYDIEP